MSGAAGAARRTTLSRTVQRRLTLHPPILHSLSSPISHLYAGGGGSGDDKPATSWNTDPALVSNNPLLSLLEACASIRQLKQVQAQMIATGLIADGFASSRIIAFCAISPSADLDYCRAILQTLDNPNVFSWNVAIRGFSESQRPEEAVCLYKLMLRSNARPDNHTFPSLFKSCAKNLDAKCGCLVLGHALKLGLDSYIYVQNAAIHFFTASGALESARRLFEGSCGRDLVTWNTLINGYARLGCTKEAMELFAAMKFGNVKADDVTMIGVVSCCAQLNDLSLGEELHKFIEVNGIRLTASLRNALMDMYMKCGSLDQAVMLFDSMDKKTMVSWTTMIAGYLKFGMFNDARRLFDLMPEKDIIPWNAMIAGYVHCKRENEALALFQEMQYSCVEPDEITIVSLLTACSRIGALEIGLWLHNYIGQQFRLNVPLGTALVDMYAKCGNIEKSVHVFEELSMRNALTWTAMICGLAAHGHAQVAISYFVKMVDAGLLPDEVTFIGVLSACCHAGFVNEGRKFFAQMQSIYKLKPKQKHYSCMVDLLGRAGFLDEAEELIKNMPMKPDAVVLGALFYACRAHNNVSMGERAALQLLELDPHDSGIYVLLANMYTEVNMREKASKVRRMMRERQVEKTPGCSSIEVNGIIYEFIVRDKSHPQTKDIHACLAQLAQQTELGIVI